MTGAVSGLLLVSASGGGNDWLTTAFGTGTIAVGAATVAQLLRRQLRWAREQRDYLDRLRRQAASLRRETAEARARRLGLPKAEVDASELTASDDISVPATFPSTSRRAARREREAIQEGERSGNRLAAITAIAGVLLTGTFSVVTVELAKASSPPDCVKYVQELTELDSHYQTANLTTAFKSLNFGGYQKSCGDPGAFVKALHGSP